MLAYDWCMIGQAPVSCAVLAPLGLVGGPGAGVGAVLHHLLPLPVLGVQLLAQAAGLQIQSLAHPMRRSDRACSMGPVLLGSRARCTLKPGHQVQQTAQATGSALSGDLTNMDLGIRLAQLCQKVQAGAGIGQVGGTT